MKAAVIHGAEQITVETVPDPTPGPGQVVVQVAAVGICGTDLHIFGQHDDRPYPITPGHEFAGTVVAVVAVGADVDRVKIGDRVSVDPGIYCGVCAECRRGRTNVCENMAGIGVSSAHPGGMAEYALAPAVKCVVLPADFDLRTAALIEPISCVVHAFDVITPGYGLNVGIYGAGPIGLIVTSLITDIAGSVSVIDLNAERLPWATKAGATAVATSSADVVPERGFDIVVDCTGAPRAIEDGIRQLGRRGTFLQFGVPHGEAEVSFRPYDLFRNELRLIGSNSGHNSFERAAELLVRGAVDPEVVISDRFALDDAPAAFAHVISGRGRKVQVLPHGG